MDLRFFQLINQLSGRNLIVDKLMILISKRIRYIYISLIVIFLIKNRFKKRITFETAGSILSALFIHILFKLFNYKPRPFQKRRVGILIPSKMDSTFPSKHTLLAFAVSTTIFLYHRTLGIFMFSMSAITGFSRIWVGHHYPSDIIGSAFLGSFSSIVTHIFSGKRSGQEN
ncbi:phosphatase PAP2 family protein [Bacillus sp. JJ1122]|uniref:phosphatase PAP2 family protein n=1 Tax=Bacillus sp. JJ1122 TaxID=3122951 RepID=UPI003000B6B2